MKAHERIEWLIAYGLAVVSAVTASLYGFMSAAGVYGVVKGAGLFGVAFIGCHGPAWIVKAKQRVGWLGALFGVLVTAVCVGATLWGGLGTNATGGAALRAERTKATADVADDRAELAKITGERAKLPSFRPAATVEADITAARASRAYKISEGCDPEHITAKMTRQACEAFRKLEGELATAQAAGRLDAAAGTIRARLGKAPAAIEADPQASAFSTLTGIPVATSAALNAFWLSLAFELGAMFAMMLAYSNAVPTPPPVVAPLNKPPGPNAAHVEERALVPALPPRRRTRPAVLIETARAPGDVAKFAVAALRPAAGESVAIGTLYEPYRAWCDDHGFRAVSAPQFRELFAALCDLSGFPRVVEYGEPYCLNLALTG
jgi:hypothetical protein